MANINPNAVLTSLLILLREYRQTRDAAIKAGDPTTATGELKTDEQLIELFRAEGKAVTAEIDALLAKHGAVTPNE